MPLRQTLVIDWPTKLNHLLDGAQTATDSQGGRCCRADADVDAETLLAIHEFEAHARRRRVQLRLETRAECMTGEMNPCFSLGAASDRTRHIARVRISFYNLQDGECIDEAAETGRLHD
jgi:hypothetical protein